MAGTGKRGDAFKPSIWDEKYFGKTGFIKKSKTKELTPINISYLEAHLKRFISEKKISEENGVYVVDADALGFKILGDGQVTKKFKITASAITNKAKEKIENAGGQVIIKERFKAKPESKPPKEHDKTNKGGKSNKPAENKSVE